MISQDSVVFFSKSNANVFSYEKVKANDRFAKCGAGKGRGFEFYDGDMVKFPDLNQIFIKATSTTLHKETYDLLSVGCEVNGSPVWVPVWALRKSVAQDLEPVTLQNMELYQSILRMENDLDRIEALAGKTCQMVQFSIEVKDPKTERKFKKKVWAVRETSSSTSSGKKASKKAK